MVHLRNCQARLTSERDARCNLEVARNQPFCAVHNAEYHALIARGGAAAEDLRNLDALVARDVDTNTAHDIAQRDVGDLERYLQALDDRVETRLILSRRFFTEPEHRALEAVGELKRRRTGVVALLRRIRERGVAVEEERRNGREDEDRKAGQGRSEVELRTQEQPQPEQRRAEETVQGDREETHEEASTARREVEVPPGAVEAVCDEPEETESVVGPEGQPTHNEDTVDHGQAGKSEHSTSSQEETTEEAERRREQAKHRIKVLNEYRRKKAAEKSKKEEEPKETLRTETAPAVGSHGEERGGIEVAGRVALACAVVGVAVFLGVRSKDAILRCH
ncbi:hypothetical protein OH76DRAFT_263515 [Lentinus brumalis]|uniref:Uncharacterized protein n=1 Tax=Lentinus brumalis TaxID=2498619 RepID=A0A371DGM5_9APHY|nr:hypothetical protein OH76DRAFT_263515 [Polyporus brumalis]